MVWRRRSSTEGGDARRLIPANGIVEALALAELSTRRSATRRGAVYALYVGYVTYVPSVRSVTYRGSVGSVGSAMHRSSVPSVRRSARAAGILACKQDRKKARKTAYKQAILLEIIG